MTSRDDIIKHLLGQHDQKTHDPTKGGGHSRSDHMPWYREGLVEPTRRNRRLMGATREAFHESEGKGFFDRQKMINLAIVGEQEKMKKERERKRELSREEKNFLHYHITENTAATVAGTLLGVTFARNPHMLRHAKDAATRMLRGGTSPNLTPEWQRGFRSGRLSEKMSADIHKAYDGTWGGLTSRVTMVDEGVRGKISVIGEITDKKGRAVGGWSRQLGKNGEVHHDLLRLDERFQGTGFSKGFYENSLREYKRMGFDRTTILANLEVGGYAWARQGFDFTPGTATPTRAYLAVRAATRRNASTRDVAEAARLALTPGSQPRHFARIGESRKRMGPDGHEHWFGKDLLLGTSWDAIKYL